MLAKVGFIALVVLVGSEAFVMVSAVLYPLAAMLHLGAPVQKAALGLALIAGLAAGAWIGASAARNRFGAPEL